MINVIKQQLQDLSIRAGDTLLVHVSLRSLGNIPDRDHTIIKALLQVLGPEGTLLMPALSYTTVTRDHPQFDQIKTPSCVGWLTEYFRTLPDTRRSLHPTHSVCGQGKNVSYLLDDHAQDHTPCGPHSPFHKLYKVGGKILMLGCGLKPNTSIHAIEELSIPPYLFGEEIIYNIQPAAGQAYRQRYIPHNFSGVVQRYDRILDVLDAEDFARGKILEAEAWVLNTEPLWSKVHRRLLEDPWYFVDREVVQITNN